MWSRHDNWIATYDALPLFAGCSRSESHFGEIALVRGICEPVTVSALTDMTVDVVGRRVASWITPRSTVIADNAVALTG